MFNNFKTKSKKSSLIVCLLLLLNGSIFLQASNCCFCDFQEIGRQIIHETDQATTFYCLQPANKGHLLVIPKRHVEHFKDLTPGELVSIQGEINILADIFEKLYGTPDFFIIQKNGKKAGQTIPHLHFHVITSPDSIHTTMHHAINYRDTLADAELTERVDEIKEYLRQK
ncbi:MAG: hypothetical protein S4CHLAM7_15030 [Chlamydiae bacterium]|nr:hypothetical protein [Chlamydiota bacterium]